MTVIDKILNEWSFRCHDGIVDIKDPKKLSVLKEILVEYKILTEDIDDDILNALSRLDPNDPRKEKVLTYLAGSESDEKDKEIERLKQQIDGTKQEKEKTAKALFNIEQKLLGKNLKEAMVDYIIYSFLKVNKEEDLINYFNLDEKETKLNVTDGMNIQEIPLKYLPDNIVKKLYKALSGSSGTKGVGKEENFLVAFYNNVSKTEKKGDITVDGQKYEVKGVGAMVTPLDIGRGSKKDVVQLLSDEFLPKLDPDQLPAEIFQEGTRWTETISDLYNQYEQKDNFIKELNTTLSKKYPGIVINKEALKNETNFSLAIAKNLINNFDIEKDEKIMFVSPNGEIKIYNAKEDLANAIDKKEIKISSFSDFVPRLTLPKTKEKTKIKISNIEDNVKEIGGVKYVSRNWYNQQDNSKIKNYFDDTKSYKNFIPLKSEYKDKIELIPFV